jgi:hypothetical protein
VVNNFIILSCLGQLGSDSNGNEMEIDKPHDSIEALVVSGNPDKVEDDEALDFTKKEETNHEMEDDESFNNSSVLQQVENMMNIIKTGLFCFSNLIF